MSHSNVPKVRLELQKLLELGIIEPSTSEFFNPLRFVEKNDGSIRICLDARFLNQIVYPEHDGPQK